MPCVGAHQTAYNSGEEHVQSIVNLKVVPLARPGQVCWKHQTAAAKEQTFCWKRATEKKKQGCSQPLNLMRGLVTQPGQSRLKSGLHNRLFFAVTAAPPSTISIGTPSVAAASKAWPSSLLSTPRKRVNCHPPSCRAILYKRLFLIKSSVSLLFP